MKKILNKNKNRNKVKVEKEEEYKSLDTFDEKFIYHHNLKPPYSVLLDTNYINDCIRKKKDLKNELLVALNANVKMYVTECVIGELEKLGRPFRVALALVRSKEILHLKCDHEGTYADNCIVDRIEKHRCYVVATSDVGLKQRIKNIPGVPIVSFRGNRSKVERFIPSAS